MGLQSGVVRSIDVQPLISSMDPIAKASSRSSVWTASAVDLLLLIANDLVHELRGGQSPLPSHRPGHHRVGRCADHARDDLRRPGILADCSKHHAGDLSQCISRFDRARQRETGLPCLRGRAIPTFGIRKRAAEGHTRGYRQTRYPQQPLDGDRSDRKHQPARKQRFQRPGAGIRGRVWSALVRDREQEPQLEQAIDYAVHLYRATTGDTGHLPPAFVTSGEVEPEIQLAMQAALQKHVDNAISKTVSVPAKFEFERFSKLFETAYWLGLKGCTTFRPNAVTGSILVRENGLDSCCRMAAAENIARNELIA